jgi:hypothetical protein
MSTEEKIKYVMYDWPHLDARGLGPKDGFNPINAQEFERAVIWLTIKRKRRRSLNRKYSSYGLKHIASRDLTEIQEEVPLFADGNTYISDGAFICAAIHLGYKVKKIHGSTSAYISIGNIF